MGLGYLDSARTLAVRCLERVGVRVARRKNVRVLGRGKRGKGEGLVHLESR